MFRIAVLALFGGCVAASAQQLIHETFVPVVDRSPKGSPISVTGSFTARERSNELLRYSGEGKIFLTNVSSKPIALTALRVDIVGVMAMDLRRSDDYFFSDLFQPGAMTVVEEGWPWFGISNAEAEPEPEDTGKAKAKVSIVFVQYADGSSWGYAEEVKAALEIRRKTIARLIELESIYRRDGEKSFLDALSKPTDLPGISSLNDFSIHADDKTKAVEALLRMRAAADEHTRMLKSRDAKHGLN